MQPAQNQQHQGLGARGFQSIIYDNMSNEKQMLKSGINLNKNELNQSRAPSHSSQVVSWQQRTQEEEKFKKILKDYKSKIDMLEEENDNLKQALSSAQQESQAY